MDEATPTVNDAAARAVAVVEASAAAERATRALRRRHPQKERMIRADDNRFGLYRVAINNMDSRIDEIKKNEERDEFEKTPHRESFSEFTIEFPVTILIMKTSKCFQFVSLYIILALFYSTSNSHTSKHGSKKIFLTSPLHGIASDSISLSSSSSSSSSHCTTCVHEGFVQSTFCAQKSAVFLRRGFTKCKVSHYLDHHFNTRIRNTTWPFPTHAAFQALSEWIIDQPEYDCDFSPFNVNCGDIIYLKQDLVDNFLINDAPRIKQPFIVVTHSSDKSIPSFFARSWLQENNTDLKLYRWFGINLRLADTPGVMRPIPLGLSSPGWVHDPSYSLYLRDHHEIAILLRRKLIDFISKISQPNYLKVESVVASFQVITNKVERLSAIQGVKNLGITEINTEVKHLNDVNEAEHWPKRLRKSLFVFAPQGNGIDTHRIYEALLNAAIPIVRAGVYDDILACLPFIQVIRWEELEWSDLIEGAKDVLDRLDAGLYDFRRLYVDHYAKLIEDASNEAKERCVTKK